MLIDWFTVAAQAANFLVLVWLLRRFLYQPIMRSMAERERRIDSRLSEAQRVRMEAAAERERLAGEVARFAAEREERTRGLREELDATRRARIADARTEVDELQARWREAVEREREGFLVAVRQRVGEEVVAVARRALVDLADEPLEVKVVQRFLDRLRGLDPGQRQTLADATRGNGGTLHVRSAFALPAAMRGRVATAVEHTIGGGCDVRFEIVPSVVGGVELRAGGQAVAWTFDDYLESLEEALAEALGAEGRAGVGS